MLTKQSADLVVLQLLQREDVLVKVLLELLIRKVYIELLEPLGGGYFRVKEETNDS